MVLLTSIGQGVSQYIVEEFTQFGTNILAIQPGKANTLGISAGVFNSVRPLSLADAEALRRVPHATHAVPLVSGSASIEARGRERTVSVFAVGPAFDVAFAFDVALGEFLPEDELDRPRPVAVLGATAYAELFGSENPLNERVRIGGDRYRVIGVMETKGDTLGFDLDDSVYIPAASGLAMFNRDGLHEIDLLYEENAPVEEVIAGVERILIARHGGEDFTVISQQQMLDVLGSILDVLTLGVGGARRHFPAGGRRRHLHDHDHRGPGTHRRDRPPASGGHASAPHLAAISRRSGPAGGSGRSRGVAGGLHGGRNHSGHRPRSANTNRSALCNPSRSGGGADRPRRRRAAGPGRRGTGTGGGADDGVRADSGTQHSSESIPD